MRIGGASFHNLVCGVGIALGAMTAGPAVRSQPAEFHPDLPRYAGTWRGAGGGWEAVIEVTRTPITPSRSLLRIVIACRDETGRVLAQQRSFGHVVDARQIDLLIRIGGGGGPLIRLHGSVPDLALSTVAGRPDCARRTALALSREP